jgi:hypothetical protein
VNAVILTQASGAIELVIRSTVRHEVDCWSKTSKTGERFRRAAREPRMDEIDKGESMSASSKKVAANRLNGQKSHGPINTTSTRFNATKHGLLAVGITELDDTEGYRTILSDLIREKNPVGPTEMFLVKSAVFDMVRWPRARRLEAECITGELNPPTHAPGLRDLLIDGEVLDPGLPAAISYKAVQQLVTLQRYESTFANRLFRTLHELERVQRMRQGERLPAPIAVDVSVHAETDGAEPANTRIVDSPTAETGTEVYAEPGQPKSLPGQEE